MHNLLQLVNVFESALFSALLRLVNVFENERKKKGWETGSHTTFLTTYLAIRRKTMTSLFLSYRRKKFPFLKFCNLPEVKDV